MRSANQIRHLHKETVGFGAFTHVELLVLVAVIAVMAMMGLSAVVRLSNQTRIAQCSNNLRQMDLAQLIYAADNSDNLPRITGAAFWPWDVPATVTSALGRIGVTPKMMYCPGTAPRFTDLQNFANTSPQFGPSSSLWNFDVTADPPRSTDFRVIGYALTLGASSIASTNLNFTVRPQPMGIGSLVIPAQAPSQRVLTPDATLSPDGINFTSILGGFTYQGASYPHICPHLDGLVPAGGNVGMLDGHVEWRPFQQMKIRTTAGGSPYFYW